MNSAYSGTALLAALAISACGSGAGAAADSSDAVADDGAGAAADSSDAVADDGAVPSAWGAVAPVLATGIECPLDLAVDDQAVYAVTHTGSGGDDIPMDIVWAPKSGSGVKTFVANQHTMTRLAVDATHVYWNQIGSGKNGAVRRLGKTSKTIEDFAILRPSTVWDLAVDGANVYWGGYEIARQGKTATQATVLGGSPIAGTRTMAIDGTHVYFSVGDDKMLIARVPLAGGTTQMVVAGQMNPTNTVYMAAMQIAVDDTYLYWTADLLGGLNRIAKDGSGTATIVFDKKGFPNDRRFAIDSATIYWAEDDGTVKSALKDGTGAVTTLYAGSPVTGSVGGFPIAVDADHVYWGFCGGIRSVAKSCTSTMCSTPAGGADATGGDTGGGHFQVDATAGTVYDTVTKLTWERAPNAEWNWTEAGNYCKSLQIAGGGWRVPTLTELESIVDGTHNQPAIDPIAFPQTHSDPFWTATAVVGSMTDAWSIDFGFGVKNAQVKTFQSRVRCVK